MTVRALLVEDDNDRAHWMTNIEARGAQWERASSKRQALRMLQEVMAGRRAPYHVVFLDFDLAGSTGGGGEFVAAALLQTRYRGLVVVHSTNVNAGPRLVQMLHEGGIDVIYAPAYLSKDSPARWRMALEIAGRPR